jgi:DegV family protein with EDD domain
MSGFVAIVTDSTACIPPSLATRMGIHVVQQQLSIAGEFDDEARVPGERIVAALRGDEEVTTGPPDPGAFFWTYLDAISQGASAIVSIHISGRMSQTCEAARLAAEETRIPVHVVDSGTLGMSLGFAVLAAARVADRGGSLAEVLAVADARIERSTELLHVDSLEWLRKGGRIGAAAHFIGNTFAIKPMLTVKEGEVAPLEKTVGADRAVRKMVDRAVRLAGDDPVDIAVEYIGADERVPGVVAALRKRVANVRELMPVSVTSIITAHVGPGAIGITVSPAVYSAKDAPGAGLAHSAPGARWG